VLGLLRIAAAHPAAGVPFVFQPDERIPMADMVRSIRPSFGCRRPDLVALVRRVAAALPGGSSPA
jgi:hypothetical protein